MYPGILYSTDQESGISQDSTAWQSPGLFPFSLPFPFALGDGEANISSSPWIWNATTFLSVSVLVTSLWITDDRHLLQTGFKMRFICASLWKPREPGLTVALCWDAKCSRMSIFLYTRLCSHLSASCLGRFIPCSPRSTENFFTESPSRRPGDLDGVT